MTELEAVYERHSVRSYLDKKLSPETAGMLRDELNECNERGRLHLQLLEDAGGTFSRLLTRVAGLGSAPAAIACAGPGDGALEERIGYWGERAVLFAQRAGLNTCWAGTFSAKNTPVSLLEGERLVLVIAVGYGADRGKPHRSKGAEQVSFAGDSAPPWFREGVRLALLAPTAINQQKFFFTLNRDGSVLSEERKGPFSRVDLGIARYHFDLARRAAGMDPLWEKTL